MTTDSEIRELRAFVNRAQTELDRMRSKLLEMERAQREKTKRVLLVDGPEAGRVIEVGEDQSNWITVHPLNWDRPAELYGYNPATAAFSQYKYVFDRLILFGRPVWVGHSASGYEKKAEDLLLSDKARELIRGE